VEEIVEAVGLKIVCISTEEELVATVGVVKASTVFQVVSAYEAAETLSSLSSLSPPPHHQHSPLPSIKEWEAAVVEELPSMGTVANTLIKLIHRHSSSSGGSHHVRHQCISGVVLHGPPGVGKTTVVKTGECFTILPP